MRKTSNANLYLYCFLALLFLTAASVDIDAMTTAAMEHQEQAGEQFAAGFRS